MGDENHFVTDPGKRKTFYFMCGLTTSLYICLQDPVDLLSVFDML